MQSSESATSNKLLTHTSTHEHTLARQEPKGGRVHPHYMHTCTNSAHTELMHAYMYMNIKYYIAYIQ